MEKALSDLLISRLFAFYGDVRPDLRYDNIYQLTIAVVLSAQTTDKQVNAVTPALFSRYPDFTRLASSSLRDVMRIIRSVGFYRVKAKHIISLASMIEKTYHGRVPEGMEELISLPGVGRKSANVIIAMGHGRPAFAVDTHIIRIANRLGYIDSNDPRRIEEVLTGIIPRSQWIRCHLTLIRHGRATCIARNPHCRECPVNDLCPGSRAA